MRVFLWSVIFAAVCAAQVTGGGGGGGATDPIRLALRVANAACRHGAGRITVTVAGGVPPYTYEWSDGGATVGDVFASAGSYGVTVRDAKGNSATANATVSEPDLKLEISFTVTPPRCYGGWGLVQTAVVGGTPPYTTMEWLTHDERGNLVTRTPTQHVHAAAGEHTFRVVDSAGCEEQKKAIVPSPGRLFARAACIPGTFEISGGVPPYKFSVSDKLLNVSDGHDCFSSTSYSFPERPMEATVSVVRKVQPRHWCDGVAAVSAKYGTPPYKVVWNYTGPVLDSDREWREVMDDSGSINLNLPLGFYNFTATDSNGCKVTGAIEMTREGEDMCPELLECETKKDWHSTVYYLTCLRDIARPIIWRKPEDSWDICAGRGMLALLEHFRIAKKEDILLTGPNDVFLVLLLADALYKTGSKVPDPQVYWEHLEPYFEFHDAVRKLYKDFRTGLISFDLFYSMAMRKHVLGWHETPEGGATQPKELRYDVDVLVLSPSGFQNDPIFGTTMAATLRAGRRMGSLMQRYFMFGTALINMYSFPRGLHADIQLTTRFFLEALRILRPRFVWPADNVSILGLAYLATFVAHDPAVQYSVMHAYAEYPPKYAPDVLSKLFKGHEQFASKELVITEDDGIRMIAPDIEWLWNATDAAGLSRRVYLKREYSEGGKGVAFLGFITKEQVLETVMTKMQRAGVSEADLSIPTRLFLQEVNMGDIIGVRLFAVRGSIIAAHTSELGVTRRLGPEMLKMTVSYKTIRSNLVESETVKLIRMMNFTGFVGVWWMYSLDSCKLVDFNARLERQMCFSFANETHIDPCIAFSRYMENGIVPPEPYFYPGGVHYYDPTRPLLYYNIHVAMTSAISNVEIRDREAYKLFTERMRNLKPVPLD